MRIGIAPAPDERRRVGDLADYVLAPFGKIERQEVLEAMPTYENAVETWVKDGIEAAMNRFNAAGDRGG